MARSVSSTPPTCWPTRRPRVVVCAATGPALVLGSRQRARRRRPRGVPPGRGRRRQAAQRGRCGTRRAGGDVLVRRRRARRRSALRVGRRRCRGVDALARPTHRHGARRRSESATLTVHDGPMAGGRWAELVCFAGLGPGEVLVAGRKLVGISQRRTRHGSRFQCMVHIGVVARRPRRLARRAATGRRRIGARGGRVR